jgi:hypothetical protein
MTNILDTIKEQEDQVGIIYGQIMRSSRDSQRPVSVNEAKQLLKDWHKSSSKALLEAVIEMVGESIEKTRNLPPTTRDYTLDVFKSDLQAKLKEELKSLTK